MEESVNPVLDGFLHGIGESLGVAFAIFIVGVALYVFDRYADDLH